MRNRSVKIASASTLSRALTLLLLLALFFVSGCEESLPIEEEASIDPSQLEAPEIPSEEEIVSLTAAKADWAFQFPKDGTLLDYDKSYKARVYKRSGVSRYAIALQRGPVMEFNDYVGYEGKEGVLNIWEGTPKHRQYKIGMGRFHLWYLINGAWAYQGAQRIALRREWWAQVPASNRITSDDGCRDYGSGACSRGGGDDHSGVDFGHQLGSHKVDGEMVGTVAAGTVAYVHERLGGVYVNHGGDYMTAYLHMDDIVVQQGQQLIANQLIGRVSNTGPGIVHEHLHFDYYETVPNFSFPPSEKLRDSLATNPERNICLMTREVGFNVLDVDDEQIRNQTGQQTFVALEEWCRRLGVERAFFF